MTGGFHVEHARGGAGKPLQGPWGFSGCHGTGEAPSASWRPSWGLLGHGREGGV